MTSTEELRRPRRFLLALALSALTLGCTSSQEEAAARQFPEKIIDAATTNWLNQTGLSQDDGDIWNGRLARLCEELEMEESEIDLDAVVALTMSYVAQDAPDADASGLSEGAIAAMWSTGAQACDRTGMDSLGPPPG